MIAYKEDPVDPARPFIPLFDVGPLYQQYFKKPFDIRNYGFNKFGDLAEIIKDTVGFSTADDCLKPDLSVDTPLAYFVQLTWNEHKIRYQRINAGDESKVLCFKCLSKKGSSVQ